MDEEQVKRRIGSNISFYRKKAGLTQAGLAERLNYSDKAVSKWERGESVPDVLTLMQLAEQFDITVNDLLADLSALPEGPDTLADTLKRKANKNIILGLTTTLVWFVALLFFVVLSSFSVPFSWIPFVYAIPVNAIVLLSLRSAWHEFSWNKALISAIVWGSLASIYVSLLAFVHADVRKIFLLGIPGQAAIFLWFHMFPPAEPQIEEDTDE